MYRPYGTQDLRPGLTHVAPCGAEGVPDANVSFCGQQRLKVQDIKLAFGTPFDFAQGRL